MDYALAEGSREICLWLLRKGPSTKGYPDPQSGSVLPLHMAALHDWGDVIKEMIAIGFDAKRTSLERKVTALHEAASCGSQSALLALLETDADVNAENIDRQTPLLEAAEGNHPEAFLPLLEARANVHHQGWEKLTALHQVAMTGNDDAAKLLLEW